ncbi:MAG: Na+/H+ antiporter [Candidatus Acidiferrales bacterium]
MGGIEHLEPILLLLLVFVVGLAALAKRLQTPYPIVLVIGGLVLSFFPHVPRIQLSPDIIFLVILPPLLFAAAAETSWRDFRYNLVSISMLALGLVGFTVWGVAAVTRWILPGVTWPLGLVLGAVVCTTDAIAATAIAHRLGLPQRLVTIIEGESMVNDASGLLAFQFAVARVVTGHIAAPGERVATFFYLVLSAIAIGLLLAKLVRFVAQKIDDAPIEITISVIAPYLVYLTAESVHSSGVLATVVCGLYLGRTSSIFFSTRARLQSSAVWETLTFVLNGIVFILIGLQLPYILAEIPSISLGRLLVRGLLLSGLVIALRMIWVYPGGWIANWIRRGLQHQQEPLPSPQYIFILGWTGMRGVVALAAALSLPVALKDGSPFPHRNVIIFLTFCVIFVTLVLQGLTLPSLIRVLGLAGARGRNAEEDEGRRAMIEAALAYLRQTRESDQPEFGPVYDDLIRAQQGRLTVLQGDTPKEDDYGAHNYQRFRELSVTVLGLQRAAILQLRNEDKINDEVMRRLETELDLIEARNSSLDGQ